MSREKQSDISAFFKRSQGGEDGTSRLGVALLLRVQEQKRGGARGEMLI